MLRPVRFTDDFETAILEGPSALVSFPDIAEKRQSSLYHKPINTGGKDWSFWGTDDRRPQNILTATSKNVVASSGLQWLIDAFYGSGLITFEKNLEDGKESLMRKDFPEFEEFRKSNIIDAVLEASITDMIYFKMPVIEYYLGNGALKSKIVHVQALDASSCRWGKMDPRSHVIDRMFFSAQFPAPKPEELDETNVFDRFNPLKHNKFVVRHGYLGPGRFVYPSAAWHSIIDSGWLDISNNIPGVKQSLLKNNMSIKYHIKIPKSYWDDKYKNWARKTADEQRDLRQSEMNRMNEFLSGKDNVMKVFISHYGTDRSGKTLPGWEIIKIDNSIQDGTLSIDQTEANAMIMFALNIDPTLKGAGLPNTKNSSGSGSDKREAKEIFLSNLGLARRRYLSWLYFIRDFNEWPEEMEFGFKDTVLTTLDKNPTGTQKTISE